MSLAETVPRLVGLNLPRCSPRSDVRRTLLMKADTRGGAVALMFKPGSEIQQSFVKYCERKKTPLFALATPVSSKSSSGALGGYSAASAVPFLQRSRPDVRQKDPETTFTGSWCDARMVTVVGHHRAGSDRLFPGQALSEASEHFHMFVP